MENFLLEKIFIGCIYSIVGIGVSIDLFKTLKEKREDSILDRVLKFSIGILIILLFFTTKYSGKLLDYIILPLTLYKIYKNKKYNRTGFEWYIAGFLGAILLSSIGAFEWKGIRDSFFDTTTVFLLPLYLAQFKFSKEDRRSFLDVGILAFLGKVSISFWDKWGYIVGVRWGGKISGGDWPWRYAPILVIGMVIVIGILIFRRNQIKEYLILSLIMIPSTVALVRTQNRANWVAILICIMLGMIIKLRKKSIYPILGGIIILSIICYKMPENKYVRKLYSITNIKTDYSNLGRFELWTQSIEMFKGSPINGIGYSEKNFKNNEAPEKYMYIPQIRHGHSHSSFFYTLATMGILGIISYGALTLKLLYFSLVNGKRDYYILFLTAMSVEIFGIFETPIKYLDALGFIYLTLGLLISNLVNTEG